MIKEVQLNPKKVRLDASTVCQLKCLSCPTATGETARKIGSGFLKFEDFKKFIRTNQQVSHIELSNWGEVFLNKDLGRILRYAYRHNVSLSIGNGANFNHVRPDVLEAIVKYKIIKITCSIDGASQEAYVQYRVKGNFDAVINNIRVLNDWKAKYRSAYPKLVWQFVAFGHNEHEISQARAMAEELDMDFYVKLSWADLYDLPEFSPVKDKELVRQESGTGAASRKEYKEKTGNDYVERSCCWDLWTAPQINYDGRVLGCPINYWGDYGNAFDKGLSACLNSEKMNYAREMLMGKREAREDVPCASCKVYRGIKKDGAWVTEKDVQEKYIPGRQFLMFENKILGKQKTVWLAVLVYLMKHFPQEIGGAVKDGRMNLSRFKSFFPKLEPETGKLPNRGYPVSIPLAMDPEKKWKPYFLFRGSTPGIQDFSCHLSVLVSGHCPHPPHTHKEEEILMMLSGGAELLLPQYQNPGREGNISLKPGEFVYYPSGFLHTLRTTSESPANYLMFKWFAYKKERAGSELPFGKFRVADFFEHENKNALNFRILFEGRSQRLSRLQAHASVLPPGAGYPPHADPYDVAIVILEGTVETMGKRYEAHSVIFYPAGKLHGMANPGQLPAKYIVFEFEAGK